MQKFDIWPVNVRVDYSPHHVDIAALTGGKYAELVNLVPWKVRNKTFQPASSRLFQHNLLITEEQMQGIELQLKHVHAAGIYGWGNVCETILGEWLEDVSQNQVCFT